MTIPIIGVDVSKHRYDCFDATSGRAFAVPAQSPESWLGELRERHGALVVFEATGIYSLRLKRALEAEGIACAQTNPRQVRRYAQACGILAKNDRIDAEVIARFAVSCNICPKPAAPAVPILRALVTRREQLLAMIQAEKGHLETCDEKDLREGIQAHLALLVAQRKILEVQMKEALEADPRAAILTSVPGIGAVTAASLIAHMPELGTLGRSQAAALAGLAPYVRDSGTFKGKRSIYGGRAPIRRALYMAALVAIRRNPTYVNSYADLIKRGKPFKVAITAIMRKMLETLNLMCKHRATWKNA